MSRTVKGSKKLGYEYWSKRIGNNGGGRGLGKFAKKNTASRERMTNKKELHAERWDF